LKRYSTNDLSFGGPAVYRIVVQGSLSDRMASHFEGMEITATQRANQSEQTTLTGLIRDQAELSGLLDTLYGMHLAIVRVEIVAKGDRPPTPESDAGS
jgi:hypothetical protein